MRRRLLIACAMGWCAVPLVHAQDRPVFARASVDAVRRLTPEQRLERRFLQDTAAHLRLQHRASQLALERAKSASALELASALLAHADAAQPEILHLLHARGMAMPMLQPDKSRVLNQLTRLQGTNFERVYVQEVGLRSSLAQIALYEGVLSQGIDPLLVHWANRQAAAVRLNLQIAQRAHPAGTRGVQRAEAPRGRSVTQAPTYSQGQTITGPEAIAPGNQ